ncbi:MAG: hypothetical protein H0V62_05530 [Gammaproteobacteria bacterium]|nr:hypothetical protein [Gammaproteobacteria bacterium]
MVNKGGYLVAYEEGWDTFSEKILDMFCAVISAHVEGGNPNEKFDLEDAGAIEGYEFDRLIISRKRDLRTINQRKEMDGYTCQACGFCLQMANGRYVIECHHLNPIAYG